MSAQPSHHPRPGLRLGRKVLHQLRAALERDTGLQAASYLQEAGFAGGEELYAEFAQWLVATRGVERPADLDAQYLSEVLSQFFSELGWGALTVTPPLPGHEQRKIGFDVAARGLDLDCRAERRRGADRDVAGAGLDLEGRDVPPEVGGDAAAPGLE